MAIRFNISGVFFAPKYPIAKKHSLVREILRGCFSSDRSPTHFRPRSRRIRRLAADFLPVPKYKRLSTLRVSNGICERIGVVKEIASSVINKTKIIFLIIITAIVNSLKIYFPRFESLFDLCQILRARTRLNVSE